MDFNATLDTSPNGIKHYKLFIGIHQIGTADIVPGGYLAMGKRKPVKTLKQAGKQCLDTSMNRCMKEHAKLHKLLQRLLKEM